MKYVVGDIVNLMPGTYIRVPNEPITKHTTKPIAWKLSLNAETPALMIKKFFASDCGMFFLEGNMVFAWGKNLKK